MELVRVSYDGLKSVLKTGDLILCHGMRKSSHISELLEGSFWSHVGMVIQPNDIGLDYSEPMFWESNTLLNLPDLILKKPKTGPMLVDLEQRLKTDVSEEYDNYFRLVSLKSSVAPVFSEEQLKALRSFMGEAQKCDFPEPDAREYIDYAAGKLLNMHIDKGNYFCSELAADTYIHMNAMAGKRVPSAWMPKDFAKITKLPMNAPYRLEIGPFIDIKDDKTAETDIS